MRHPVLDEDKVFGAISSAIDSIDMSTDLLVTTQMIDILYRINAERISLYARIKLLDRLATELHVDVIWIRDLYDRINRGAILLPYAENIGTTA